MDDLTLIIQSMIDSELDDLILDLVYDIHSSMKGIPEDQLELTRTKHFLIPFSQSPTTAIEKQTCLCPHCGQSNIIAIRFAYHLAKCLGVGRRSSRQAKNRIVDQVMTITASSDESRSNGDDIPNLDGLPEDIESCTDSTSSSSNNHRRMIHDDQEYRQDFDHDDEDEDDWKPKKKKRKNPIGNIKKKKKKPDDIILIAQPIPELDFDNCIIPLDKICPQTQHVVISSDLPSNGEHVYVKNCQVTSPLNLVEDEQSSTTSIIMFQEDNNR